MILSNKEWSKIMDMVEDPETDPEEFFQCAKDELADIKNFPDSFTKVMEIIRSRNPQLALYLECRQL